MLLLASCWCFSSGNIKQLPRLSWNFLWAGIDGSCHTTAQDSIIWPKSLKGTLAFWIQAFRASSFEQTYWRGLTPGEHILEVLSKEGTRRCSPELGGVWILDFHFSESEFTFPWECGSYRIAWLIVRLSFKRRFIVCPLCGIFRLRIPVVICWVGALVEIGREGIILKGPFK